MSHFAVMGAGSFWSLAGIAPPNLLAIVLVDGHYTITGDQELGVPAVFGDVAAALGLRAATARTREEVGAQSREGVGRHDCVALPPDVRLRAEPPDHVLVAGRAAGVAPGLHEKGAALPEPPLARQERGLKEGGGRQVAPRGALGLRPRIEAFVAHDGPPLPDAARPLWR